MTGSDFGKCLALAAAMVLAAAFEAPAQQAEPPIPGVAWTTCLMIFSAPTPAPTIEFSEIGVVRPEQIPPERLDSLFDPGSFVLTAFGRFNGGTVRGDKALADRFLGMFFRI